MATGSLQLTLVSASISPDVHFDSESANVYAIVRFIKQNKCTKHVPDNGRSPVWNETFTFDLHDQDKSQDVHIQVYNVGANRDELLGVTSIPLSDVISKESAVLYPLINSGKGETGKLKITWRWTPAIQASNPGYGYSKLDDVSDALMKLSVNQHDIEPSAPPAYFQESIGTNLKETSSSVSSRGYSFPDPGNVTNERGYSDPLTASYPPTIYPPVVERDHSEHAPPVYPPVVERCHGKSEKGNDSKNSAYPPYPMHEGGSQNPYPLYSYAQPSPSYPQEPATANKYVPAPYNYPPASAPAPPPLGYPPRPEGGSKYAPPPYAAYPPNYPPAPHGYPPNYPPAPHGYPPNYHPAPHGYPPAPQGYPPAPPYGYPLQASAYPPHGYPPPPLPAHGAYPVAAYAAPGAFMAHSAKHPKKHSKKHSKKYKHGWSHHYKKPKFKGIIKFKKFKKFKF